MKEFVLWSWHAAVAIRRLIKGRARPLEDRPDWFLRDILVVLGDQQIDLVAEARIEARRRGLT